MSAPGRRVRTVLGDREAADLGAVDYHEHLFQVSPLLPGDELDDEAASTAEAASLAASGFDAMVDATPTALGRDPQALARASAASGLAVVATTGAHREVHYGAGHWLTALSQDEMAARFTADVVEGMPVRDAPGGTGGRGGGVGAGGAGAGAGGAGARAAGPDGGAVRAGMLKAGVGYWSVTAFERRVLGAVATTHRASGAPVMVHTEHASAAHEVLDVLADEGVGADAVVLAHVDRCPDPGLHAELAARGAYLGYDGPARHREHPDSAVLACLVRTAALGAAERILLGGDVARATRYRHYPARTPTDPVTGRPGLAYLGERFVPRLAAEGGEELCAAVLRTNPQRLLGRFAPDGTEDPGA